MNEPTRSQATTRRFQDPELTIAVGLLTFGAVIYAIETLVPSLLFDGGDPIAFAAVFGVIGLVYLAVLLVARVTNAI